MRIRIEGLEEFRSDINKAVGMFPSVVRTAMDKSTRHIKNEVQDKIISEKIPYTGQLQQSIYAKVTGSYRGEVFVGAKHGIFVERGTRPHWPPREPIERWAAVKLHQPGLGFVISRKIARVGTKAHEYFKPAVETSVGFVEKTFNQTVDVLLKAMAGK
jgi:hypothetical protein